VRTQPSSTARVARAPGPGGTRNAVAQRGDLVVIHLRHRDRNDGQPQEHDDFWLGQVTSITRAGLVRLVPGPGAFPWVILRTQGAPHHLLWWAQDNLLETYNVQVLIVLAAQRSPHLGCGRLSHRSVVGFFLTDLSFPRRPDAGACPDPAKDDHL